MADTTRGITRRRLVGGTAAGGLALPVLVACGGGGEPAAPPPAGEPLASTDEVPVGGGLIVGSVVITQPTEGEFKAFSSTCTHQGCAVSSVSDTINCNCHGSAFAITDGSVQGGPAGSPLPEVQITVDGSDITTA